MDMGDNTTFDDLSSRTARRSQLRSTPSAHGAVTQVLSGLIARSYTWPGVWKNTASRGSSLLPTSSTDSPPVHATTNHFPSLLNSARIGTCPSRAKSAMLVCE